MRKIVLAVALAAISGVAMAEWVEIGGSERTTVYVDPATIRRSGNMAKMWRLFDFKSPQRGSGGATYLSSKGQAEYDCKDERHRGLYFSWHSGNMGAGTTVHSDNQPNTWEPVSPESIDEALWKVACGKK